MAAAAVVVLSKEAEAASKAVNDVLIFLDGDDDGVISPEELEGKMKYMQVHAGVVIERLTLEENLMHMCIKMPNFLMCVICFLIALTEISPASLDSAINQHIEDHFALGNVPEIKDMHSVYTYMEEFAAANGKMNPLSGNYWCEQRYSNYRWDDHYLIPIMDCKSPRMGALGIGSTKWSELNASGTASAGDHHDRRLRGLRRMASSSGSGGGQPTHPNPPCIDDDYHLKIEEDDPNATCAGLAAHVCDIDLGIKFCMKTCGFCAPFVYEHIKRFDKPQVVLLPAVVYQTRFEEAECHDFAHDVEMQDYNPVLTLMPALDGHRNGRILTCVDRTKHQTSSHALKMDCPDHTPSDRCIDGKVHITPRVDFHGETVYAQVLIESHRDLVAMETIEWIGVETDTVAISTMVYTEHVEIFSSLTVEFSLDLAGNIKGSVHLLSYRDLTKSSRTTFVACLIITSVFAFIGCVIMIVRLLRHPEGCNWGLVLYELISRILLCVYPCILLVSWSQQKPMSDEFEHLLDSFLNSDGLDDVSIQETLGAYFVVKTEIYEQVSWLSSHRAASYFVCYVQMIQLILYFNAHPRMAMLTSTIKKSFVNMTHFFMLFFIFFVVLCYIAHWLLGGRLHQFGTFSGAMQSQVRMLFGEFIYADGTENLDGVLAMMYWLYAITFMIVVFFTLLNFFLAIVVDAFVDVKSANESLLATHSFLYDVSHVPYVAYMNRKWRIPVTKLVEYLEQVVKARSTSTYKMKRRSVQQEEESTPPLVDCSTILKDFEDDLTEESLSRLLCRIQKLSDNNALCFDDLQHQQDEEALRKQDEEDHDESATIERPSVIEDIGSSPCSI